MSQEAQDNKDKPIILRCTVDSLETANGKFYKPSDGGGILFKFAGKLFYNWDKNRGIWVILAETSQITPIKLIGSIYGNESGYPMATYSVDRRSGVYVATEFEGYRWSVKRHGTCEPADEPPPPASVKF